MCAVATVRKSVRVLQLFAVTSAKCPTNPVRNPNLVSSHNHVKIQLMKHAHLRAVPLGQAVKQWIVTLERRVKLQATSCKDEVTRKEGCLHVSWGFSR
jgi:hypothetical protein